jgi:hypothetical protein
MAVEAHHDQVDIVVGGARQDHVPDIGIGCYVALHCHLDAVTRQPCRDVGARLGAVAVGGRVGIDAEDDYLGGCLQERQRIRGRACALAACVPAQHDGLGGLCRRPDMRHHQDRPAGRQRHGLGQIQRNGRRCARLTLPKHHEIGVARMNGQARVHVTFLRPPFGRELGALHGLGEGRLCRRQVCPRRLFEDAVEVAHCRGPVEHRRRLEWLLDVHADKMGVVTFGQLQRDGESVRNVWAGVAMHEDGPVGHGRLLS